MKFSNSTININNNSSTIKDVSSNNILNDSETQTPAVENPEDSKIDETNNDIQQGAADVINSKSSDIEIILPDENQDSLLCGDETNRYYIPKNSVPKYSNLVTLDPSSCHLDMNYDQDLLTAYPQSRDGFSYIYSDIKATHGLIKGIKAYFEVEILDLMPINAANKLLSKHSIIIGFSSECSDLNLGNSNLSFGLSSDGHFIIENIKKPIDITFGKGDKISVCAVFLSF